MRPEDLLKLTENTATVAFHKFVLLCKGKESDLYCFFEGRDAQYYSPRIKSITKKNYHPISCGNKKSVVDVHNWVSSHNDYKKYSKTFFVDSDFDNSLNLDGIYETPCYSVENFYVNTKCLSEILKNEFGLTEIDVEYKSIINLFEKELEDFSKATLLFNAWYAGLKSKKQKEGLKSTCVSLSDKLPNDFVCIKIGAITSNYDLQKIMDKFPDAIKVDQEIINAEYSRLNCAEIHQKLRGKYQFSFFYEFLRFLIDDANSKKSILKKKTKFNIDKANMYGQLSQYALTTECLTNYLLKCLMTSTEAQPTTLLTQKSGFRVPKTA